jgi:CxxC motif-containing protein
VRENREFICVTCPVGCTIEAVIEGQELIELKGNACRRGIAFVREEISNPRRMLTTTVQVDGGALPLLPVHSNEPLPKHLLLAAAAALRRVRVTAPVTVGQVIVHDLLGTGVDMQASRPVPAKQATD